MDADTYAVADGWPPEAVETVEQLRAAVRELEQRTEQLERALESRIVIEQAKGVLAERLAVPVDDAFALLRGAARSAQTRLHDVAREVVAASGMPEPLAQELARRSDGDGARR